MTRTHIFVICIAVCYGSDQVLYPDNSLWSAGSVYPFGGSIPSSRVFNTISAVGSYIICFGGYSTDGSYLNDVSLFHIRDHSWSSDIVRNECCNSEGQIIDAIGLIHDLPLRQDTRIGFQGDIPLARAEHGTASALGNMYLFGGISPIGYLNDLYTFNPLLLQWKSVEDTQGSLPMRRAGHAMISHLNNIYVFGGRGLINTNELISLNDIWLFDTFKNEWNLLGNNKNSLTSPCGRQYSAIAIFSNRMYIFGGMDPSSSRIFNDMWAFNLHSQLWSIVSPNTGSNIGFAPPPLYLSRLIPIATHSISSSLTQSLLVYGGIGNGGSCASNTNCEAKQTSIGQVYRFDITLGQWVSYRLKSPDTVSETDFIIKYAWNFARLTSASAERGRLRKLFAFESTAISEDGSKLYELGGLIPIVSNAPNFQNNKQSAKAIYGYPLSLDNGGILETPLWDLFTGEQLRDVVDIPTFDFWNFSYAFARIQPSMNNFTSVGFLKKFRTYSINPSDIVLIDE